MIVLSIYQIHDRVNFFHWSVLSYIGWARIIEQGFWWELLVGSEWAIQLVVLIHPTVWLGEGEGTTPSQNVITSVRHCLPISYMIQKDKLWNRESLYILVASILRATTVGENKALERFCLSSRGAVKQCSPKQRGVKAVGEYFELSML